MNKSFVKAVGILRLIFAAVMFSMLIWFGVKFGIDSQLSVILYFVFVFLFGLSGLITGIIYLMKPHTAFSQGPAIVYLVESILLLLPISLVIYTKSGGMATGEPWALALFGLMVFAFFGFIFLILEINAGIFLWKSLQRLKCNKG